MVSSETSTGRDFPSFLKRIKQIWSLTKECKLQGKKLTEKNECPNLIKVRQISKMQCDLENLTDATIKPGICLMNCRGEGRERDKLLTENNGCRHEENCMKGQQNTVFSKSRMVNMCQALY